MTLPALWGCLVALIVALLAVLVAGAPPWYAVLFTGVTALILIGSVLYDEWRHPAGYWTTTYR